MQPRNYRKTGGMKNTLEHDFLYVKDISTEKNSILIRLIVSVVSSCHIIRNVGVVVKKFAKSQNSQFTSS